jgi:hypothetical protein
MKKIIKFLINPFVLITIALAISYFLCVFLFKKDSLFYIKFLVTATLSNGLLTNILKSMYDRDTQKEMLSLNRELQKEISDDNKKVQNELIKLTKKLEASNIVHKVQFEKEFNIYVEIWEKLFKAKVSTTSLYPKHDKLPLNLEEREDEYARRYNKFAKDYNDFSEVIIKYMPFYNEIIYNKLIRIRNILHEEGFYFNEVIVEKNLEHGLYLFFMQDPSKVKQLDSLIDGTSRLIQNHIKELTII